MGAKCRRVFGDLLREWPQVVQVAAFTPDQVKRFVERWYGAIPQWGWLSEKEAAEHAANLQPQLDRDYLVPLARNPLLLTLLVALDCSNTRLPDDRTELYEQAVELLLKRWNERVGADVGLLEALAIPTLKMSDLRDRLEQVALDAHEAHTGNEGVPDLPRGALLAAFEPLLADNSEKAKLVVDYVEKRAGLLIAQGARLKDPLFRFVHRTFQEYLAACALRDEHDPGERAARLAEADAYHWREVLRFAARIEGVKRGARLADDLVHSSDAPAWLLGCPAGVSDWRRAIVAAEQLQEIGLAAVQGNREAHMVLRRVAGWLAAMLDQGGLSVVERAQASRLLGHLGDPRPGVQLKDGLLDPQDFVRLPPGRFRFAETSQEAVIDGPFHLSRYPVTVAQYEAFVAAGGYADDGSREATQRLSRWWSKDGLKWKRREKIAGPADSAPMFQTPNHPRVGVSWFEAEAFCGWLTEQLRRKDPSTEGHRIGLPSEAQWEWAARWSRETGQADDRRYPWGGSGEEDLAQRCNMHRTGLGQTSVVGLFRSGQADCGAMDLSGNVWEWCAGWYDNDEDTRVVRGGSWFSDYPESLSCGYRNGGRPGGRFDYFGFRCVWVEVSAR